MSSSPTESSTPTSRAGRARGLSLNTKREQSMDDQKSWSPSKSSLSPNLQPSSPMPPILAPNQNMSHIVLPSSFGDKYILVEQFETSNLYKCFDTTSLNEFCCKVVPTKSYHQFLAGHLRMDGHSSINSVEEVVVGKEQTYVLFSPAFGDLHSYVRSKKRLRESEAMDLFHQIVSIVSDCHNNGIILRDLKLRKFLFKNKERNELKLETLEDAAVLEDEEDDMLSDKHGCPAYVSPEILSVSKGSYSAKQADCWSLGVILYTLLVGRYPFHDTNPSVLFCKIRRGQFVIPDSLSAHAKCLIRSLMRREPTERLSAEDILSHRWFQNHRSVNDCKLNKITNNSTNSLASSPSHLSHLSHPSSAPSVGHKCCKSVQNDQTVPDLIDADNDSDSDDSSLTQSLASDL